ncbi:MAG: hypothetical protein RLZZ303_443 [Candidatus Hydrogenedentota bacterium]
MNSLLLLAAACLGFSAELLVCPDQPLQFSYIDEPVVIAVKSDSDVEAKASVTLRPPRGDAPIVMELGTLSLKAGKESWHALPQVPAGEGFFQLDLSLEAAGESKNLHGGFARIRRSTGENALPVFAYGDNGDARALRALRSAPVPAIRIDLLDPELEARATALRKQGFKLVPYLDARATPAAAETARKAAEAWCDAVLRWDVAAGTSVSLIQEVAEAVRTTKCPAPVVAVVDNIDTFKTLIEQGLGNVVRSVVVEVKDNGEWTVSAVQRIAEQAGFEQWDVYAMLAPPEPGAEEQRFLTKRIFLALAEGFETVGFHAREIYDGGLTAAFSRVNALSFQFGAFEFAGSLPLERGVESALFKHGGDWFLTLWRDGGDKELLLELGDAGKLKAMDQFNQPIELPEVTKGVLPVRVGPAPIYLTGRGGSLFDLAARPQGKRLASELAKRKELIDVLGPEIVAAINSVVLSEGAITQRTGFFAMVRALPDLERRWHQGELPRHIAVSAISHLARLLRQLCVVEQQRGEPFLEPLQDTLARCEEYQAYYLTSSRGSDDRFQRGDWLLGEVRRLMNEANDLAAAGRRIEASAVAALAEWRARGLEFAASASQREEEPGVTVALALPEPPPPAAKAGAAAEMAEDGVHVIVKGDTLGAIAARYGVKLRELMAANNLTARSTLRIGQKIKIPEPVVAEAAVATPPVAEAPESKPEPKPEPEPEPEAPPADEAKEEPQEEAKAEEESAQAPSGTRKVMHTVERGETTRSIANKYGVSEADFRKWNGIRAGAQLARGKQYVVHVPQRKQPAKPESAPQVQSGEGKQITHTVRRGENPYLIAKKYKVSLDDFLKWNKLNKRSTLQVGDKYVVYVK